MGEITNAELVRQGFATSTRMPSGPWTRSGSRTCRSSTARPALRRFFDEWPQTFPDSTVQVEDVEERGDWTLSLVLQMVSGAAGGTPVPFRYGGIGHWRHGRLDFVENHPDMAVAREAFKRHASGTRAPSGIVG